MVARLWDNRTLTCCWWERDVTYSRVNTLSAECFRCLERTGHYMGKGHFPTHSSGRTWSIPMSPVLRGGVKDRGHLNTRRGASQDRSPVQDPACLKADIACSLLWRGPCLHPPRCFLEKPCAKLVWIKELVVPHLQDLCRNTENCLSTLLWET